MLPLFLLFACDLLGLFAVRLSFFLRYAPPLSEWKPYLGDLLAAFWLGVRLDLRYLVLANIPFLLLLLLGIWGAKPSRTPGLAPALKVYSILVTFVTLFLALFDFGYYAYFHDHINPIIFGVAEDDTGAAVRSAFAILPIPFLLALLFGGTILLGLMKSRACTRFLQAPLTPSSLSFRAVLTVLLLLFSAALARGSVFTLYPLGRTHVALSSHPFINQIPMNGIFALYYALRDRKELDAGEIARVLGREEEEEAILKRYARLLGKPLQAPDDPLPLFHHRYPARALPFHPHVVLIVLESFGLDLALRHTRAFPVLGSLAPYFKEGILFRNFLPSANGTAASLMTMIVNLPPLPGGRVYSQMGLMHPFPTGAGFPFLREGYRTVLLYGGDAGWRNLDPFARNQGFEEVLGRAWIRKTLALPQGEGVENPWGVLDEYLFAAGERLLRSSEKPLFLLMLSTTNHPPFVVPEAAGVPSLLIPPELMERSLEEREKMLLRFRAYAYTAEKLGAFLERLKGAGLLERTIVGITGDHNFWGSYRYAPSELISQYAVPFLLLVPRSYPLPGEPLDLAGDHRDLLPTLYHLALTTPEYLGSGESLLNRNRLPWGMNERGLILGSREAVFAGGGGVQYYCRQGFFVEPDEEGRCHNEQLLLLRDGTLVASYFLTRRLKGEVFEGAAASGASPVRK